MPVSWGLGSESERLSIFWANRKPEETKKKGTAEAHRKSYTSLAVGLINQPAGRVWIDTTQIAMRIFKMSITNKNRNVKRICLPLRNPKTSECTVAIISKI